MIACLDCSGAGEGSVSGAGGGKGAGKGAGRAAKGAKVGKSKKAVVAAVAENAAAAAASAGASSVPSSIDDGLAPPMFLIASGAPPLEAHRPALDDATVQAVFAQKRAAREERIAKIVAEAKEAGRPAERMIAAIIHDSEQAPYSTNRRQLVEIGVACPPSGPLALAEADVTAALWRVIYGLAHLGIYLTGTNHLDDRALLRILSTRILEEEIRDVPPSRDMSEFIDLTPCRAEVPDGLEGPFDDNGDDLDDLEDPIGPGRQPRDVLERDALLPRPRREAM
jgi:hypothetical protein